MRTVTWPRCAIQLCEVGERNLYFLGESRFCLHCTTGATLGGRKTYSLSPDCGGGQAGEPVASETNCLHEGGLLGAHSRSLAPSSPAVASTRERWPAGVGELHRLGWPIRTAQVPRGATTLPRPSYRRAGQRVPGCPQEPSAFARLQNAVRCGGCPCYLRPPSRW